MKLYKLTDRDGKTKNDTQWGEGVTIMNRPKENPRMCSGDVIHAYTGLDLAFMMNQIHANISDPRVFDAEGDVVVFDPLKVGCFALTTTKEIEKPWWVGHEDEKRVRVLFAVLCAESSVNRNPAMGEHLEALKSMALSGTFDKAVREEVLEAAWEAAVAAAWAAAWAAEVAAEWAVAAAVAAEWAVAREAARAAARAAAAVAREAAELAVARAAEWAAEWAARAADSGTGNQVDFAALAEQAANTILGLL
jgi:hypothetical protein